MRAAVDSSPARARCTRQGARRMLQLGFWCTQNYLAFLASCLPSPRPRSAFTRCQPGPQPLASLADAAPDPAAPARVIAARPAVDAYEAATSGRGGTGRGVVAKQEAEAKRAAEVKCNKAKLAGKSGDELRRACAPAAAGAAADKGKGKLLLMP